MNLIRRLVCADNTRKTRFHTANGYLCVHPYELAKALLSTTMRLCLKRYSHAPWLAYPAASYVSKIVPGKRIFEFGSGMSTIWFSERCREVVSVESDSTWYRVVAAKTNQNANVTLIYANSKEDYLGAISTAGGRFDVIFIDGMYRTDCVELARAFLTTNGVVVVDNTDANAFLVETIEKQFGDATIRRFHGYAPGNFHPDEVTVVENVPIPIGA